MHHKRICLRSTELHLSPRTKSLAVSLWLGSVGIVGIVLSIDTNRKRRIEGIDNLGALMFLVGVFFTRQ